MVRDYYNEGAMDLITLRENEAAFDRYKIIPRVLRNVDEVDTTTELFGTQVNLSFYPLSSPARVSLPFGFSPAASQKLAHPDGELATSRAAANFDICMGLSSYSNYPLEDVVAQGNGNPYVIQMCVLRDRNLTLQLLERAEKAGYKALFLSVDVPVLGKRLNEYRHNYTLPEDMEWPNILSNGSDTSNRTEYDPSLDWDSTVPWLREHTRMQIWLKGVCSPADVELAIHYAIDGLVISNHGGRQLDGVPSTIDSLRACARVARGRIPLAIDGGIRRGSDIFKALALGATYCFVGRIPIWGLAYNGQEGVELAIKILRQELRITMALSGASSYKMVDLNLDMVAPNGHRYVQPTGLFINNELVPSSDGSTIASIDPATDKPIASVHSASNQDVDRAVKAAKAALVHPSWKSISGTQRGVMMARLADLIEENKEMFATIDAWDNGKPYHVALEEDLPEAITTIRYYSGWADKIFGQTIGTTPSKFAYTIRQPVGVVGQIIPWNYPLSMAAWKLGPALACGNTVVLKPAEQTPLSALVLGKMIIEAGFPPGVVNIINGYGRDTGVALVSHPLVDKIAFTGSTNTAREIMKLAARHLKNITLETGGKSPLLVFSDADFDQAVKWSHFGIMSNQGQICTATSRIYVQQDIFPRFLEEFKQRLITTSKIGDQWDESTFQGPQVSRTQYERILSYIETAKAEGARIVTGGTAHVPADAKNASGYFIEPTIITGTSDSATIVREEVFGPVVVIEPFSSEGEAIRRANDTVYGLGAAIFTKDLERAHRVAAEIESGMVWVNSSQDCDPRIPFGGVKQSGIGRELGEAGLEAYSQIKSVHVNMGNKL
ncbi:aldehyde dehydrogenase ALDH [Talaromyces islandicus]|uniref:Oxidase FUB9 n=1 Tax=Talaromyces islandicus TaxID=28573 RepID=A0A0U1LJQ6_TALIS|nr:aldehyde dehydrogenase ALDH [Talaromyces islandicus]